MTNHWETQQQREDRLTAAQALVELSLAYVEHTSSQVVMPASSSTSVPFPSGQQAVYGHTIPAAYNSGSNRGSTSSNRARTATMTSHDAHLAYLHPSTSAFARPLHHRASFPCHTDSSIAVRDFAAEAAIAESRRQAERETREAQEAATILMNLHRADQSRVQNAINLLSVPGRSGLKSRGVFVRRQGALPVDERLSTEIPALVMEEVNKGKSESVSNLTSLEDLEEGLAGNDDDKEYQAATPRARPGSQKRKRQGEEKEEEKEKPKPKPKQKMAPKKNKTSSGAPLDYQRFNVRDNKGRFVKK